MQVNATLIAAQQAAQQAAREARARVVSPETPAAGFSAALEKGAFAPLALKQLAAPAAPAMPDAAPAARPGSRLDITI